MKAREALGQLRPLRWECRLDIIAYDTLNQALDELEEFKERDAAMKVKINEVFTEGEKHKRYSCPYCGDTWFYTTDSEDWKFCPNCGQRLDWSEKDEKE